MPLRKKHVRRIVLALLAAGVLGPLVFLACYAAYTRGGAYGRAIETELASRLRCEATVRGARPTGVATAAADSVELTWTAGEGRLTLRLEDLEAERKSDGWYVAATNGEVSLSGPTPMETLSALNQRLVQVNSTSPLAELSVDLVDIGLDLPPRRLQVWVGAIARAKGEGYDVEFLPEPLGPSRSMGYPPEPDVKTIGCLLLSPRSRNGVFAGLHAQVRTRRPLLHIREHEELADGTIRVATMAGIRELSIDWHWPQAEAQSATFGVGLDLSDMARWTKSLPGGPVTGRAELAVTHVKGRQGAPATEVVLTSGAGTLGDETLWWLTGLPAGLAAAGPISAKTIAFDRLALRCRIVGDRGQFEGPPDADGTIPVLTCRLFGVDVPIVKAGTRTFDAAALWAALKPALAPPAESK